MNWRGEPSVIVEDSGVRVNWRGEPSVVVEDSGVRVNWSGEPSVVVDSGVRVNWSGEPSVVVELGAISRGVRVNWSGDPSVVVDSGWPVRWREKPSVVVESWVRVNWSGEPSVVVDSVATSRAVRVTASGATRLKRLKKVVRFAERMFVVCWFWLWVSTVSSLSFDIFGICICRVKTAYSFARSPETRPARQLLYSLYVCCVRSADTTIPLCLFLCVLRQCLLCVRNRRRLGFRVRQGFLFARLSQLCHNGIVNFRSIMFRGECSCRDRGA